MRSRSFSWLISVLCLVQSVHAADWPMHRFDAARSGYTTENLPSQLSLKWTYHSAHPPMPAWPREDRMQFDRAFRVVVANGTLFFGSSADNQVYALDAATGKRKWTFFTDSPVRLAPAVWKDRLFVVSDDGYLYCLSTADGSLIRKLRGAPDDQRILGNGRIVSRWPGRGGPVIVNGIVYFSAGIWPSEGIHIYAIDAETGKTLWENNKSGSIYMPQPHGGAYAKSGVTVQGHLVATSDHLFAPTGRAVPAAFSRADGKFKYYHLQKNGHRGGTPTMASGPLFYNSGMPFEAATGNALKPVGPGPIAAFGGGVLHSTGKQLRALRQVEKSGKDRKGQPVKYIDHEVLWTIDGVAGGTSLAVAGNTAVAGSAKTVSTIDLKSKKVVWSTALKGAPYDLAVANGRLYVSTDQGTVHCFTNEPSNKPIVHRAKLRTLTSNREIIAAAKAIIEKSGITEGYCVDLGCGDGSLAVELAKQTKLHIYAIDSDPKNVAAARKNLVDAGLYGVRVTVHQGDPSKTNYPRYFANLIVSGRSLTEGAKAVDAKELFRIQRPYGGVACIGTLGEMKASARGPLKTAGTWTHQYSNAANTLASTDEVKGPLHVLWFRDVDLEMPQRHGRGHAPLFVEGRLFVEGMDAIRGVDAYNGRTLWEFKLPGILRAYNADHLMGTAGTGSNICVAEEGVYVRTEGHCFRLDAATGKVHGKFAAPKHKDGKKGIWGYVACHDGILFGTLVNEEHVVRHAYLRADTQMSKLFTESKTFFALDAKTGILKWRYDAKKSIRHNAVAIGDGRVFLIDRARALNDLLSRAPARRGEKPAKPPEPHTTGELICLDAKTGKQLWATDKDIYGTLLAFSEKFDLLLMSYQSTRFKLPSELGGRMAVFRASEGYRIWDKKVSYNTRPLVNDRIIYAQPAALDLITGKPQPFDFKRSYGCGQLAGSKHLLLFRSATLGYFDLSRKAGTENFGGVRPGCWVNALPVGGLVLLPDASAGCRCSYQNRSWVALEGSE